MSFYSNHNGANIGFSVPRFDGTGVSTFIWNMKSYLMLKKRTETEAINLLPYCCIPAIAKSVSKIIEFVKDNNTFDEEWMLFNKICQELTVQKYSITDFEALAQKKLDTYTHLYEHVNDHELELVKRDVLRLLFAGLPRALVNVILNDEKYSFVTDDVAQY
ncbi:hypothetical protein ROZALSC1DRAFT_20802 [Rozella allomycis CSF55]|uniref:Uncharacterized protein n=1 Tax=Rozella allomycis (strain CSF55) TaxID=988480 RepID=A0A4V1J0C9_ROZAC|nr:hypothetical protein ROZALSC1DRAFT_20802 [Rozella allomycis CSF55]